MFDKSETKQAYQYDLKTHIYAGEYTLNWMNRSPVSGAWQIPAGVTTIAPPEAKEGFEIVLINGAWYYQEKPQEETEPELKEPTTEDKKAALIAQLNADKDELMKYYTEAVMLEDEELAAELKAEFAELIEDFETAYREVV